MISFTEDERHALAAWLGCASGSASTELEPYADGAAIATFASGLCVLRAAMRWRESRGECRAWLPMWD